MTGISVTSLNSLAKHFSVEGYVVIPKALPPVLLDEVLLAQKAARKNPLLIYRGQGVVGYERPKWDEYGHMIRSIQNPHLLGLAPRLSRSICKLVFSSSISDALLRTTGISRWVNWQTMLFDRSVGTEVHLDTWFLDTEPKGHLIGAWMALEDIQPEAGPFLIYPRSQELAVPTEISGLNGLIQRKQELSYALEQQAVKPIRLLLRKGDLVLWNSLVAHGSDLPTSKNATRKSVTAHFYPYEMNVANPPIQRFLSIYNHKKPREVKTGKLYQAATIMPSLYSGICVLMYILQRFMPKRVQAGSIRRT